MHIHQLLKRGTEHDHQVALFAYCSVAYQYGFDAADRWAETGQTGVPLPEEPAVPALEWYHAIPNGGSRGDSKKSSMIRGMKLKAEGVRKGVADTFLPWPSAGCHGLYIEMKKPDQLPKRKGSKGGMSDEQIAFRDYTKANGYGFMTCYGWKHAVATLQAYIEWNR